MQHLLLKSLPFHLCLVVSVESKLLIHNNDQLLQLLKCQVLQLQLLSKRVKEKTSAKGNKLKNLQGTTPKR